MSTEVDSSYDLKYACLWETKEVDLPSYIITPQKCTIKRTGEIRDFNSSYSLLLWEKHRKHVDLAETKRLVAEAKEHLRAINASRAKVEAKERKKKREETLKKEAAEKGISVSALRETQKTEQRAVKEKKKNIEQGQGIIDGVAVLTKFGGDFKKLEEKIEEKIEALSSGSARVHKQYDRLGDEMRKFMKKLDIYIGTKKR